MTAVVLRGDARALPLPDASVDLVVCSPPYYALRDYRDGDASMAGQIGSEATPAEWLAAMVECVAEMARVLKPSGSIFLNVGDKYNSAASGQNGTGRSSLSSHGGDGTARDRALALAGRGRRFDSAREKSLLGLPWRLALACTDQLGLILRRDIIWCLSGGARVYARMPGGDRPIMLRDLVRHYQPENVQLWNGHRWTQVLGWNRSPDRDGALELELRTGERIGCTPGHRWPTQRGVIRADEARVGDVIQTTRLPEPDRPRYPGALPGDDIGWLIGLYMAEGSHSGKTLQFAGHLREEARNARLAAIAAAYHGNAAVYRTSENGITCNISGAVLLGIVEHYIGRGRTALSKRFRKTVWQRSDRFLRAVMDGYLEGDGHYDAKNDRWRLGFTQNDEWAADLRTLAARLGAKLSLRRAVHTYDGRSFPGWRGEWRWTRSAHHNVKQDGEVVAIRSSRAREFYDVGVADEPHLFALASGVLTHNSKPNGLPESVTDRCRSSHEYLFHLVKQPRYYAAVDEIREPHTGTARSGGPARRAAAWQPSTNGDSHRFVGSNPDDYNPLGKLPGSVWTIPSQPLTVPAHLGTDHFAAFPMELPRRCILGWSPPGICTACGEGRRPVGSVPAGSAEELGAAIKAARERLGMSRAELAERIGRGANNVWDYEVGGHLPRGPAWDALSDALGLGMSREKFIAERQYLSATQERGRRNTAVEGRHRTHVRMGDGISVTITGYACACPDTTAPTRPALVVDPFGGTGTTSLVASMLGRTGVSIDRSADYCRLARWRTTDPAERARAMQVPKPPPVPDGQVSLFDLDAS